MKLDLSKILGQIQALGNLAHPSHHPKGSNEPGALTYWYIFIFSMAPYSSKNSALLVNLLVILVTESIVCLRDKYSWARNSFSTYRRYSDLNIAIKGSRQRRFNANLIFNSSIKKHVLKALSISVILIMSTIICIRPSKLGGWVDKSHGRSPSGGSGLDRPKHPVAAVHQHQWQWHISR